MIQRDARDITGFRHGESVQSEHPQMPGTAFMRFQLILPIRRDSAQVTAQRRRIRWCCVHGWHCRSRIRNCDRSIGHYCWSHGWRLRIRLECHPYSEATRRVHLVILILIRRLL